MATNHNRCCHGTCPRPVTKKGEMCDEHEGNGPKPTIIDYINNPDEGEVHDVYEFAVKAKREKHFLAYIPADRLIHFPRSQLLSGGVALVWIGDPNHTMTDLVKALAKEWDQ